MAKRLALAAASALVLVSVVSVGSAFASAGTLRVVRYGGYRVSVPAGWAVYRLRAGSNVCVRFNRAAVYLGRPGRVQNCPAHAVGRPRAILIEPGRGVVRSA